MIVRGIHLPLPLAVPALAAAQTEQGHCHEVDGKHEKHSSNNAHGGNPSFRTSNIVDLKQGFKLTGGHYAL